MPDAVPAGTFATLSPHGCGGFAGATGAAGAAGAPGAVGLADAPLRPRCTTPTARFDLPISTFTICRSTPGLLLISATSSAVMYVAPFGFCASATAGNKATLPPG